MITLEDLMWTSDHGLTARVPDMDPFTEDDALQEAQLLDFRVNTLLVTTGILLELRTALHFESGNAALLIVRGASGAVWSGIKPETDKTAWVIVGSSSRLVEGQVNLVCSFWPHASLDVTGARADFYVVDVPEIGEVPPDYCEDSNQAVRCRLPQWDSPFSLLQSSHLGMSPE